MTTTVRIKDKAINTAYTSVTGTTSGAGTGATFDVIKTNGVYSTVLNVAGTGYVASDTITILGTDLGGTVANNLILTVATVGVNGTIATFGSVGTGRVGDGVLDVIVDVEGTDGVDTYTFWGDSTDYAISFAENGIIATSALLNNVEFNLNQYERVVFNDKAVAYDLVDNGAAGQTYSLLAAAFGVADVTAELMGMALAYKDQGLTKKQLADGIVNSVQFAEDAGGFSNETFVKNVFQNVVGRAGTLAEIAHYVDVLELGNQTKADLLIMASNIESFQDTINLVGMQTTGLEYIPFTI
jgi:hypothetical protein